jgi:hypothetical protein
MRSRLIQAQGLWGKVIAGALIRAGSTPTTDMDVFASAALSFVLLEVPKLKEYRRLLPYFPKGLLPDIAAIKLQIPAGLHLADV